MIKIPNPEAEKPWFQDNRGNSRGSIQSSFNLDLASNLGKVRTTRTKRVAYTGSPENFGQVVSLERFDGKLFVASENSGGHDIWEGGNTPFDTLTNDTTSVEIVPSNSDMLAWNNGLYVCNSTEIKYSTNGTTWSEVGSDVLASGTHLLTAKNDLLYVSDEIYKVKSVTSGNSFQGSGSQTLDLNMPGYGITMLMAGIDQIWIGLSSEQLGAPCFVFEWDGETENTPTARYEINASGIMAGVIKDGVPYIVDSMGRLLRFDGGGFTEVARFPNLRSFRNFNEVDNDDRAIHPRGMGVDGDEVLICVANRTEGVTADDFNDFPSGVWAYSEDTGLYHKFSASYQAKGDTGTTNLTDHGQHRAHAGGPLLVFEPANDNSDTADAGGHVVFGMEYYVDADDTGSDTEWGLFADDTRDNTQKAGWYVSPRIRASEFRDNWEKIYAAISDLETTGDLVEIKARTKDDYPTYAIAEWTGGDRFNTITELTAYEQGDEVSIVQGKGSGAIAHATSVTSGAGSEVVLDRDIQGITAGITSVVRLEKWTKIGKVEDIDEFVEGYTYGVADHWMQVKLYMQWTGPRELHAILINNISSLAP